MVGRNGPQTVTGGLGTTRAGPAASHESRVRTSYISGTASQRAGRGLAWRRVAVPYLYMAPFLLLFVVFKVYPLARMTFPGRNVLFAVIVGSMMVPSVIT
ncbi:MAG: hypothetical protein JOY61_09005, partial [Chloroflexi bacterium]|nr:hypothetical protein [Chloroflexota bacterium]